MSSTRHVSSARWFVLVGVLVALVMPAAAPARLARVGQDGRASKPTGRAALAGDPTQAAMQAFLNYSRPATYSMHETPDILVPMRDGYQLTCDLYQPALADGSVAPGRFPSLVVSYEGYGRNNLPVPFGDDLRN